MSTSAKWGWRRRWAEALDRVHVLGPAVSLYETALGVRGAVKARRLTESGGLPVPPAQLRARIAPAQADLNLFLRSGALHADLIRGLLAKQGAIPSLPAPILDFGCGCGRIARHWDGLDIDLHGCDVNPRMVDWCRRNLPFGRFEVNGLEPPLPYEDPLVRAGLRILGVDAPARAGSARMAAGVRARLAPGRLPHLLDAGRALRRSKPLDQRRAAEVRQRGARCSVRKPRRWKRL